jgi:hypothetical protein
MISERALRESGMVTSRVQKISTEGTVLPLNACRVLSAALLFMKKFLARRNRVV